MAEEERVRQKDNLYQERIKGKAGDIGLCHDFSSPDTNLEHRGKGLKAWPCAPQLGRPLIKRRPDPFQEVAPLASHPSASPDQ